MALDAGIDEYSLTYETPLHVEAKAPPVKEQWQRLLAGRHGYVVHYETTIPATVKSYHLVASTAPEAGITRMYLTTDADRGLVNSLVEDLEVLAERAEAAQLHETGGARHKILELQAQTILRKLADLLRRRKWEASQSGLRLAEETMPACHRLAAAATGGEALRTEANIDNALVRHPAFTAAALREAARELTDLQFGDDVVLVTSITDNEGRAYWRHSGGDNHDGEQIRVRAGLVLEDATKSGPFHVMLYALAVSAVSFLLGWLLVGSPWFYGRAATEALSHIGDGQSVITMLLLVPGFLYTRLSLPPRSTVVGYLGTLPRALGQLSIVAAAGLAAAIATQSPGEQVQVFLTLAVGFPLLAALLLQGQRSWRRFAVPLSRLGLPRWGVAGAADRGRPLRANVRFDSSGSPHDAQPARLDSRHG